MSAAMGSITAVVLAAFVGYAVAWYRSGREQFRLVADAAGGGGLGISTEWLKSWCSCRDVGRLPSFGARTPEPPRKRYW
jgi:hypothetical protein